MATLTSKKKTIEEMAEEINRGAKSSSSSVKSTNNVKVKNNTSVKSVKDTNRDFSLIDAYMQNQKKQSFSAPSSKLVLPYTRDEMTIKDYESIPNYNVFERATDKSKADAYKRKQSMLPSYKEAKSRTVEKSLKQSGLTDSEIEALSAGTFGNKAMVGLDIINAYINRDKRKAALEKLKNSGSRSFSASDILDYAQSQSRKKETQELSDFSDKHKVLGTALTFPMNAGGGVSGLVGNTVDYLTGNPIDPENYANHNTNTSNQMRSAVSDDMGKVGQFLYNVGTSIGDSLTSQAISGGNAAGAAALQGSQAFTNSAIDTANRGLTPNQIMSTSSISAAAETLFEKLSLDNLKGILKGGTAKDAGKSLFKDILGQMKTEAGEEMATEVANAAADYFINGELSNFVQSVEQYQNTGMSEDDAKKQAWKDLFGQIAYAGAAGAVSGGIMGGGASLINKIGGKSNIAQDVNENSTTNEMNLAKSTGEANVITAPEVLSNDIDTAQKTGVSSGLPGSSNNSISNSSDNVNVSTENVQNDQNAVPSDMVERIRVARENLKTDDSSNQRVRGYNDTLVNKTDAPQELKNEFINNPDLYTQLSNKDTLARANEILANNDINSAINQYRILLDKKDPVAVPLGYNLSKQLSQSGRLDESVQLVRDMSRALTESGQFSQAAAITLMNNDPEAAKRYLIREIDTLNQKGKEKYGNKWTDFELTESELQQFSNIKSGDTDSIKSAYEAVYDRLRKQYPSTMTEKLMEFRRMSMLLNARTNVRNVVSNALLFPVRWTADRVSALGEGVYSLINPKYSRTQSINPIRSKQSKKLASEAFETVKSELLGDNKYEDSKGAIRDKQVFKGSKTAQMLDTITGGAITKANQAMGKSIDPSLLETARNFTYYLLEKGDNVFVKKNFESRMASYLDAQGITELDNIPADAYVLATQEAMKATFKDDTKLSKILSDVRRNLGVAGEIVLPFTKTPANLAMRGIDYSPAGALNGLNTIIKAKNNTDIAKGITQLGQAATGTAAIALGYALAEAGLITGALSEDKDEAQFQKQQGMLPYAFKIGENYYSYDWAQPASIPIILGVTLYDSWNNNGDAINGLKQGLLAAADSWLELSPLQNLSDIFGGYGTTAENVWSVLTTDTPLSFIPSQLGAAARIGDTTQRVTYDNTSRLNNLINQAKAKIPGLSQTLPVAYDTWGNPIQRQDSTGEAAFANLLNPGQLGNANVSPIDDEISSLYDSTGNASVFPKKASWSYKVNGENVKLNNEQYSEFQRIMGANAYDMVSSLINSDTYNSLSDDKRVEAISDMYSFADALAKSEVLGYDVENSDTYKKTYSVYKEKGADGVATYFGIKQNLSGSTNADKVNAVNSLNISDEAKGYYLSKLISTLSNTAQAAYEESGYAGIYQHYQQETMEDRIKQLREQSAAERIKALREQSNSGVTDDMVQRIKELRSQL